MTSITLGFFLICVVCGITGQQIPVQTLHAVDNRIKAQYPSESRYPDQNTKRDFKREKLMKIRELETQRSRRQLEEKKRIHEVNRLKHQMSDSAQPAEARRHHSVYNPLTWTDIFVDVLIGHGRPGGFHRVHRRSKKKKMKKMPHNGNFQFHNQPHVSHFGNPGWYSVSHGGNLHPYEIIKNFADMAPQPDLFSWFKPSQGFPPIQNKIAPGFHDSAR
ncbi:uncharacterized protein [Fopius arisanus]|uniref:SOS2 protein n=1 Tax=Fopius arisanus TaxID=64838 RepID=A0A0C9RSX9_9HYME|nr:PREDICTED: uncharacterized protein LOC105274176 isoform X2 [Fopius arisanus]